MKNFVIAFACFTAVLISSCSVEEKEFSGTLGSCETVSKVGDEKAIVLCIDYQYTQKGVVDKGPDAKADLEDSCEEGGGTFTATACSPTGSIAKCVFTSTNEHANVTATLYYSGTLMTEETSTKSCETSKGTYTKL